MSAADRDKWERRYRAEGPGARAPNPWLCAQDDLLPRSGRALDVAGGAGRDAVWLARRGLAVTLCDVSPHALALAEDAARTAGVGLETRALDLETAALPAGPWDVISSANFLRRPLFSQWPRLLGLGGLLVFVQPTLRNLERSARPPAGFLLGDGELPGLLIGLEIVRYEEGWKDDRCEARLVARRAR